MLHTDREQREESESTTVLIYSGYCCPEEEYRVDPSPSGRGKEEEEGDGGRGA